MAAVSGFLTTQDSQFVDGGGRPVRLRGVAIGGWLNMENFITGYSANESLMRKTVREVIGDDRADRFFERLLTVFFAEADASFLGDQGFNVARIPFNYRHLESDARPFQIEDEGFRHLDRAIDLLGAQGIYSVIDLHALPGYQNHHWHSDNPTGRPLLWEHPHFQERTVNLWQAIADHYRDHPWVGGYNLINEPADESRQVIGPFYRRLVAAVREIDPNHTIYLDGNTYATEFDFFDDNPFQDVVYTLHDYVPAGLGRAVDYDREAARQKFLQRSAYARQTGTPIAVGEFGPIYTGDPERDAERRRILADQLDLYREFDASWMLWTYKDVGLQGLVSVDAQSPYRRRFDDFIGTKVRLSADQWGTDGRGDAEITDPLQEMVAHAAPHFDPYPWGRFDFVRTLTLNVALAQALAAEYAELFRGLDDDALDALADSFSFAQCRVRGPLLDTLRQG